MKTETANKLSDPALLAARERHLTRLEDLFAGRPLEHAFVLNGIMGSSETGVMDDPAKWAHEALASLVPSAERLLDETVFRPLVLESWIYGVHFIDHLLGGRVYFSEGQWWCDFLKTPVGSLQPPDLEKFDAWRKARDVTRACVELDAAVPLISSQVLSSPLNIIVNLYGEEILTAMLADEDAARRDLRVVTDLIRTLHQWYSSNVPADRYQPICVSGRCQPRGYGQICGCTTHLISAAMYRDLVAPLDDEVLGLYPHGGLIHLCGDHTRHIPVWRELKSFRAFQINDRAAEDLEIYFKELREDQIIYLNPTPTMTVDRAMKITGGRRIVIVADVEKPLVTGNR